MKSWGRGPVFATGAYPAPRSHPEERQAYSGDSLAQCEVPDCVEFFEDFPMAASDKIMKCELRALVQPGSGH
jgi:hypothetical protein